MKIKKHQQKIIKKKQKELESVANPIIKKVYDSTGGAGGGSAGGDDDFNEDL